jgi:hypothetical protein
MNKGNTKRLERLEQRLVICGEPAKTLADMNSMDDLRARFNEDAANPRLVLLLSPT